MTSSPDRLAPLLKADILSYYLTNLILHLINNGSLCLSLSLSLHLLPFLSFPYSAMQLQPYTRYYVHLISHQPHHTQQHSSSGTSPSTKQSNHHQQQQRQLFMPPEPPTPASTRDKSQHHSSIRACRPAEQQTTHRYLVLL